MDKGVTCDHLNKLAEFLGKDLWQSKENLTCFDCGCPGPNLWICLQPECHHVGCSEVRNDHSTLHQKSHQSHCVHMNVSTERVWCYICEREVHVRAAVAYSRMTPDSTMEGAPASARVGAVGLVTTDDDLDDDELDDGPRGVVGLQNMGNTCYMNAALQALSNTAPFTSYFLSCAACVSVLAHDKKPGLSRAYQKLVKEMWSRKTRGYLVPNGILYGIRNVHPMFRGYQQHDTQEFLRCFMDQLHEELKEPIWDSMPEDKLGTDADGDHQESRREHRRRRAASSGASDSPLFARMRRKSPASSYSESRTDGYLRVSQAESATRHRRSASFAGTQQAAYAVQTHHNNPLASSARDIGSESSLSCSSDPEERYETCSSGASDADPPHHHPPGASDADPPVHHPPSVHSDTECIRTLVEQYNTGLRETLKKSLQDLQSKQACGGGDGGVRYRSIISDVFDGKLLSSVQCLICDRVSTRVETFQDLSLPIPSREHLAVLRSQPLMDLPPDHESWMWWILSWLRSWFYGPVVSLQDCLAAFFSADELKGDNMYSCSRCNKLRNGVKLSGVVRLPEVLCVHLKRFRHELMFSAKVAARVSFPQHDLNMQPYTHKDCTSKITRYSLCAVICHTGTAGGGHYTCVARNPRGWFTFDDQAVTPLAAPMLHHTEAYVLFYRKVNPQMTVLRQKAAEILESTTVEPNDIKFYISKQWINKFNTWAEPGPIDNGDFVCAHGGLRPDRARHLRQLAALVPQPLWEFLYSKFGGGPACSHVHECAVCARAQQRLRARRARELKAFYELHAIFQEQDRPRAIYAISMHWFRQWQAFVRSRAQQPPPPVDNTGIVTQQEVDGVTTYVLKHGSDHAQLSEELWRFFTDIYGGGPPVPLRLPPPLPQTVRASDRRSSRYSESDKEDYCSKSTSDTNIRDSVQSELQKNQSLQNLRHSKVARIADSDDEDYKRIPYKRYEPNGNYPDSDEDMEDYANTVKLENGIDGSDHDANDNPVHFNERPAEVELPDMDSISLKSKPSKTRKVRRNRKRTVK